MALVHCHVQSAVFFLPSPLLRSWDHDSACLIWTCGPSFLLRFVEYLFSFSRENLHSPRHSGARQRTPEKDALFCLTTCCMSLVLVRKAVSLTLHPFKLSLLADPSSRCPGSSLTLKKLGVHPLSFRWGGCSSFFVAFFVFFPIFLAKFGFFPSIF